MPDSGAAFACTEFAIRTKRRKRSWFSRSVLDSHWEGVDCGTGALARLDGDAVVLKAVTDYGDVRVNRAKSPIGWEMLTRYELPSKDRWRALSRIAQHLLESSRGLSGSAGIDKSRSV